MSKVIGGAKELDAALLIHSNNIEDIAAKISIAFSMSQPDRICRWMMAKLRVYPTLTTVTRDGVTQRAVHSWPEDKAGKPVRPKPMDWARRVAACGAFSA
ncbi:MULTISPECIES: hypothetical protein [Bradyrhizobium]|uniref:Trehalose 6-phosphate synthase n=1 Tax=Bradyrhizobium arachidis TaxID=858423 RepID=A0AAE7NMC9_9BRAD|nr:MULTISPECIES: hypothetical protein [Bradyrhizobium]QOZ66815.1 hypothetical protein WN72_11195 [Bradyrhizobium arachidis]